MHSFAWQLRGGERGYAGRLEDGGARRLRPPTWSQVDVPGLAEFHTGIGFLVSSEAVQPGYTLNCRLSEKRSSKSRLRKSVR